LQQSLDRVLNDIKNRNNKEEIFNYLWGYLKNKKGADLE
jgi:hypothetical protein